MTLVGRTLTGLLGILGVVLLALTAALYLLARSALYHDVDVRLAAALETLGTAAEESPRGFEWEPHERRITLGVDGGAEQVRWIVCDGEGALLTQSENLAGPEAEAVVEALRETNVVESDSETDADAVGAAPLETTAFLAVAGETWRVHCQRFEAWLPNGRESNAPTSNVDPNGPDSDGDDAPRSSLHPALVLTAALSVAPVEQTLSQLLLASCGVSAVLWAGSALVGRQLCRRALSPLTGMAAAARAMPATAIDQRLPLPGTGDELEDLAVAFNGLLGRVQEAFERQRSFTSEASHQLRTPLTAVLGQVEVALRQERTAAEYRDALQRVERQGRRMVQIVETLLFLARADSDAVLPGLELADLGDWLRSHLKQWSAHARASDLVVEVPDRPLPAQIHAALLGQLVDNLLDNACKYSQAGTPITVRAAFAARAGGSAKDSENRIVLEVEDRGIGVSAEDHDHLFQPFFRSSEARRLGVDGVGLGLAVVKRIAAAMGGMVRAHSALGQGSTFSVELNPAGPQPAG